MSSRTRCTERGRSIKYGAPLAVTRHILIISVLITETARPGDALSSPPFILGTQTDVLAAIVGISFRPGEQTAPTETNFSFAPAGLTQPAGQ